MKRIYFLIALLICITAQSQTTDFITRYGVVVKANTVGTNLLTLTNPSAITFLRINADNSITARTASQLKSDLAIANTDVSGLGTLATQNGTFSGTSSGTNTGDQTITLTGDVTGSGTGSFATTIGNGKVTNGMLAGSIAYSKLSLTGAILNADLAGSIAYSKLSLTGAILNADLAGSIAASKLVGTDITTVGTIGAGTWQGSIIAPAYLGTGSSITTKYLRGDGTWQTIAASNSTLTISSPLTGSSYDGSAPVSIGITDAAADGSTKGAATFTAADFNSSSGNISIDYTNGQKASSSVPGFATSNQIIGTIGSRVDGQGGVVSTGSKGYITIPYSCTITNWYVAADVSGSIQFDIKRSGTSIVGGGGNKPLLSSAVSGNAAVSGWTSTSVSAGDILEWVVDSATTVTNVSVVLKVIK